MAQALTLARPYARAAFETAHAEGKLADWSKALAFAAAVSSDARVQDLLNDPRVQPAQLVSLHLPSGTEAGSPFGSFLAALADQRRLSLLPEVEELFDELKRESEHTLLVKVTSALAGEGEGRRSNGHYAYVALEVIKVIALIAAGVQLTTT